MPPPYRGITIPPPSGSEDITERQLKAFEKAIGGMEDSALKFAEAHTASARLATELEMDLQHDRRGVQEAPDALCAIVQEIIVMKIKNLQIARRKNKTSKLQIEQLSFEWSQITCNLEKPHLWLIGFLCIVYYGFPIQK